MSNLNNQDFCLGGVLSGSVLMTSSFFIVLGILNCFKFLQVVKLLAYVSDKDLFAEFYRQDPPPPCFHLILLGTPLLLKLTLFTYQKKTLAAFTLWQECQWWSWKKHPDEIEAAVWWTVHIKDGRNGKMPPIFSLRLRELLRKLVSKLCPYACFFLGNWSDIGKGESS